MTHKASNLPLWRILDYESFWILLKSTFLAFKKSGTSCPNLGGGGNLDKIQKNSYFFREAFPK